MPEEQKLEYSQLDAGYEFSPSSYKLDDSIVSTYLEAVEDTSRLYKEAGLVPPMVIAAYAMAALARGISLPPGTIHVSQGFEFIEPVNAGETLTSYAKVNRKQSRRKFNLLDVDINVLDKTRKTVLAGKTSFILPELGGER